MIKLILGVPSDNKINYKRMKTIVSSILFLACFTFLNAQESEEELFKKFNSSEWKEVKASKEKLENFEAAIIPELIEMTKSKEFVKLQNTGSLIYPGAVQSFGYGQIIEYDIDRLGVRAGWLLEDLTFQNFGFSGAHYAADQLEPFIKVTFAEYYNNSTNRKKILAMNEDERRKLIINLASEEAENWWAANKSTWTRLDALYDALKSYDEKRQVKALFYLRNGKSKCTGLTEDFYIDNLYREIRRLSKSETPRVSEHATFILMDIKYDWLELKPVN